MPYNLTLPTARSSLPFGKLITGIVQGLQAGGDHTDFIDSSSKPCTLNRSTYYKDSKRKPTKKQLSNNELDSKILKVYYESKRHYGAPNIFKVLRNEGHAASLKRIQRRMAALGIKSVVIKKYKPVKAGKK